MSEILRYVMDHNKLRNMMPTSEYLYVPKACWLVGMFFVPGLERNPAQENRARIIRGDGGTNPGFDLKEIIALHKILAQGPVAFRASASSRWVQF